MTVSQTLHRIILYISSSRLNSHHQRSDMMKLASCLMKLAMNGCRSPEILHELKTWCLFCFRFLPFSCTLKHLLKFPSLLQWCYTSAEQMFTARLQLRISAPALGADSAPALGADSAPALGQRCEVVISRCRNAFAAIKSWEEDHVCGYIRVEPICVLAPWATRHGAIRIVLQLPPRHASLVRVERSFRNAAQWWFPEYIKIRFGTHVLPYLFHGED